MFTTFTDDIQIVVIHGRGVYNFIGINLVPYSCVSLFCYNALFKKKLVSDLGTFLQLCTNKSWY